MCPQKVHKKKSCHFILPPNVCGKVRRSIYYVTVHPFTAKCKFLVRPKITVRSAQDRYSVIVIGVIYGVLAILCRSTKHQLCIVSPRVTSLLLLMDKECGNVNEPCKRSQSIVKNT